MAQKPAAQALRLIPAPDTPASGCKYSESTRFSEKAIELNPGSEKAIEILKNGRIGLAESNSGSNLVKDN